MRLYWKMATGCTRFCSPEARFVPRFSTLQYSSPVLYFSKSSSREMGSGGTNRCMNIEYFLSLNSTLVSRYSLNKFHKEAP